MNYERLDPLGRGYVDAVMAQPFGDATCMKLFGVFGFSRIGSEADLNFT